MSTTSRLDIVELAELQKLLKRFGCVLTPADLIKRVGPMDKSATRHDLQRLRSLAARGGVLSEVEVALREAIAAAAAQPRPTPPAAPKPPPAAPVKSLGSAVAPSNLFLMPDAQIQQLRDWNARHNLGIADRDFVRAERRAPQWPPGYLSALVLVPYLDNQQVTLEALLKIISTRYDKAYAWSGFQNPNAFGIRLGSNDDRRVLRWETIDFGCHRGCSPASFSNAGMLPHVGVLSAVAHHVNWVKAMDGVGVPFVWLSGYILRSPLSGQWVGAPRLTYMLDNWKQSTVRLSYEETSSTHAHYAVPHLFRPPY